MPSRADLRLSGEHVLRGMVIVILSVLLWQSLHKRAFVPDNAVEARTLAGRLPNWTVAASPPRRIHLALDTVPKELERDWLRALSVTGSAVSWGGDLPAVMIATQPIASPIGGMRVSVAAPGDAVVEVRDEIGVLDTVRARNSGASLMMASGSGRIAASVRGSVATTTPRDSIVLHKVLVIGDAGWESKFVIAALEEEGWKVDAFVRVAPGIDVTQGSLATVDTSRYSAVVALDDAAVPYANRIAAFVRTGGGVVLAPQAAALEAMAPLRAAAVGRAPASSRARAVSGSVTLATLGLAPLVELRNDAVPLDKRDDRVAVAARRIGAGRLVQFGYQDSWRWRMGGGENSLRDHRAWWTGLVSNVAYAPRVPLTRPASVTDEAPLARLVAAIGPRSMESGMANHTVNSSHWTAWVFVLLSLALIAEVASRRLRGAG